MGFIRIIAAIGVVALASTAAFAFQEQTQGGAAPAASVGVGASVAEPAAGSPVTPKSGGTEIRIPGLGRLGTLPKLDFGMELLYGANEASKAAVPGGEAAEADGVAIRGSVKHKF